MSNIQKAKHNTPLIGAYEDDGQSVTLDLSRPLPGVIITGNSGAGKSRGLRVIIEQLFGRVPIYVFDPEDELYTLREQCDFVLVGASDSADIELHPDRADKLASMLISSQTSAIISINDLELEDRQKTVANFLHAAMAIPRSQARPAVFALDEADFFVAEGSSRSKKKRRDEEEDIDWTAECSKECIDLCVRGRKRGYTPLLATQRPAMIAKAASSQCLIKFIGRQVEDVDIDRAVKALGMQKRDRNKVIDLKPGEFWALGPALPVQTRALLKFANPETTHPEPGSPQPPTPAPRAELVKLLESLKVEENEKDASYPDQPVSTHIDIEKAKSAAFKAGESQGYGNGYTAGHAQGVEQGRAQLWKQIYDFIAQMDEASAVVVPTIPMRSKSSIQSALDANPAQVVDRALNSGSVNGNAGVSTTGRHERNAPPKVHREQRPKPETTDKLPHLQRQILIAIAPYEDGLPRPNILMRTGFLSGGHASRAFSWLFAHGLAESVLGNIRITPEGLNRLGEFKPLPTGKQLFREIVDNRLTDVCRKLLLAAAEKPASRPELLQRTGFQSGGHASRAFSKLLNAGYLVKDGSVLRVNDSLR